MRIGTCRRDGRVAAIVQIDHEFYFQPNTPNTPPHADPQSAPSSCLSWFGLSREQALERVRGWQVASDLPADVDWQPPIANPGKILCVGLNYADHARETGKQPPSEPLIFSKLNTTLRGNGDHIVLPPVSQMVDFEAELVVVIGRSGHHIPRHDAIQHVAGYMCGNDVSARDWQKGKPGGQWLLGKSFDSFAPTGPWFVTADEVHPQDLSVQLRINGTTMQDSHTSEMLFPVDELISYISQVCTLVPGDLIFTGTPHGVGVARDPQVFLQPGDEVAVEISGLGVLRNPVVASKV